MVIGIKRNRWFICLYRVLGIGYWVLAIGYWVLGIGYWVLGIGKEVKNDIKDVLFQSLSRVYVCALQ